MVLGNVDLQILRWCFFCSAWGNVLEVVILFKHSQVARFSAAIGAGGVTNHVNAL